MKKFFLLLGPFLFSVALQGNVRDIITPEKEVSKTVQFSIYASTNYSRSLYKQSKAKILLSIWKVSGNNEQMVWETTIDAGKLTNYPTSDNPLFREVSIHNVKNRRETLVAGYKLVYSSGKSTLAYDKGYVIPVGDSTKQLYIPI